MCVLCWTGTYWFLALACSRETRLLPSSCLIQINHQPDATIFQFIILPFIYSSTCFGRSPAHHQELNDCSGSLWFYLRIVVTVLLCSWSGRAARPRTHSITKLHLVGISTESSTMHGSMNIKFAICVTVSTLR